MAHEIEGNRAFYTLKPAWHKLGTVLETAPNIEEACALAYPHTIVKLPCAGIVDAEKNLTINAPEHCVITRDDGKVLAVMGNDYTFPQPREAFSFFQPFMDKGLVELESGGSLRDGKRMWALAKVKGANAEVVKGDEIKAYYLVYTSFDGSLSHGIMPTNTRVVCANTLRAAIESDSHSKTAFKLKHTKNLLTRIDDAQRLIAQSLNQFQKDIECYQSLAKKPCSDVQLETYLRDVLETPEAKETSTRAENKLQYVLDFTKAQPRKELLPIEGTYWNAYNGVTNYLSHEYGRNDENRTDSLWFGTSANVSQRALELAIQA